MSEATYYKVSYVIEGGQYPGGIVNMDDEPAIGDELTFNGHVFAITEITELMPAVGDFGLLHATCRYLRDDNNAATA